MKRICLIILIGLGFNGFVHGAIAAEPNAEAIVEQCDNKYPGDFQRSQLSITLKDKANNERKNVYLRLWKDMKGDNNIADKMVLFALYPPDAKGAGFMRWTYMSDAAKGAEQWIYLPVLKKIRRVSVRDLSDSFLGSDLTYGDISLRRAADDTHKLMRVEKDKSGQSYYVIESTPKEQSPQYSKRISWYKKVKTWSECVKTRVDYFDLKGALQKRQNLQWQKVGPAWVWDKVVVRNAQTFHSSFFEVTKVKINDRIKDEWFTERRLRLGLKI